jgi:hypothetical protein
MDKVAHMLVAGRRRYARAAKDFPLAHALFALATFVAVCGKVLAETPDTKLDFARQFDMGAGRKLFLECRGAAPAGYPTVVLISGYYGSSDSWTEREPLELSPLAVGPAVLPGLARENRVCAYDRPGTLRVDGRRAADGSQHPCRPAPHCARSGIRASWVIVRSPGTYAVCPGGSFAWRVDRIALRTNLQQRCSRHRVR